MGICQLLKLYYSQCALLPIHKKAAAPLNVPGLVGPGFFPTVRMVCHSAGQDGHILLLSVLEVQFYYFAVPDGFGEGFKCQLTTISFSKSLSKTDSKLK